MLTSNLDMTDEPLTTNPPDGGGLVNFTTEVDGHSVHCLHAGSGPPVMLMHGGASDSTDWLATIDALADSYAAYAPDMIGYGLSGRVKESYSLSDFVTATHEFIGKLGLGSLALVGHSLGGRICLEIALRHPEIVTGLVLIDTPGFAKLAWWGGFLGAAAWGVRRALGRPQPYPRFRTDDGEDRNWRCLERLPHLRVPTLIIWNRRDPYYSVSGALKAAEVIPDVQLEVFPRYGHAPHKQDIARFNRVLLKFLNSLSPRGSPT